MVSGDLVICRRIFPPVSRGDAIEGVSGSPGTGCLPGSTGTPGPAHWAAQTGHFEQSSRRNQARVRNRLEFSGRCHFVMVAGVGESRVVGTGHAHLPGGTGFNRDDFCLASVPGMGSGPSLCPEKSRRVRGRRLNETGSCPERDLDPGYSRNVAHSRERVCALLGRRKSTGCRQRLPASWAHTAVPGPLTSVGNSPAINSGSICGWSAAYKVLQIQGGIGEFRIPYELLGPANRWRSSTGWGPGT